MTHDVYEDRIMSMLRRDHTKTYTILQIRLGVVGSKEGYSPIHVSQMYEWTDDALERLVRKDMVYEKKNDSGDSVYGIRISRSKRIKNRIDESDAQRRTRNISRSLDGCVKKISPQWLALGSLVVAIAIAVMLAIQFQQP